MNEKGGIKMEKEKVVKEIKEEKSEEKKREGWREALIAITTTVFTFSILYLVMSSQRLLPLSKKYYFSDIVFYLAPFFLSFMIFYRSSKNLKKSIIVGILGLVFWLITALIIALLLLSGWH